MHFRLLSVFIIFNLNLTFSQEPILINESTIILDLEQTKDFYFSFAEGDEIVFDMEMIKGKHIKEIEITEMPSNTLLTEFKSREIRNKRIQIRNKGIYRFRFYSSSITRRICKIKIHRIPADISTKKFNTNWKWEVERDTIYVPYKKDSLVGYKTIKYQESIKELIQVDTTFVEILARKERVHSETAIGKSQYSSIDVYLPKNSFKPNHQNPYELTKNIAWSYWIGVGQKSNEDYEIANDKMSKSVRSIASLSGYGALAELAISGISFFNDTSIGDNVNYKFITVQNNVQKVFVNGNSVSASGRNTDILQGGFTIQLFNDNFRHGIDVNVKIIVAQINKIWKDVVYNREKQEPQYVTLDKTRMEVKETRFRVPVE